MAAGMLALAGLRCAAQTDTTSTWQKIGDGALVIDVRTPEEFAGGHLDGALNIVHDRTEELVKAIGADKGRPVVLYCRSGRRSGISLQELVARGYTNVVNGGAFIDLRKDKPAGK